MGYYSRTNLRCTNPEIISSGSTFNQMSNSKIIGSKNDEIHYATYKNYMHNELIGLSKKHSDETFTAKTWLDTDYYERVIWTLIYKNGEYEEINSEPGYVYSWPSGVDENLVKEFQDKLSEYLDRIRSHLKSNDGDPLCNPLNNHVDKEGFGTFITFKWETEDHRFIATNKFGYMIEIEYENKDKENLKRLRIDNKILRQQLNNSGDEEYCGLPF